MTCDDPIGYAITADFHRRHLTPSQRAQCAAAAANMKHGGDRKSQRNQAANLRTLGCRCCEGINVSTRLVETAKHVATHGDPAVVDAVKAGSIAVSAAAKLVDAVPDHRKQRKIIKKGRKAVATAIKLRPRMQRPSPNF